jgi:flagellar basal-body rod protein FlgB
MDLAVFSIGHSRSRWLAARAAATAVNVAHADTPGYRPRDISPFEAVMKSASVEMGRTQARHLAVPASVPSGHELVLRPGQAKKHSGNGVSLETEMASLGETRSQQSLAAGIVGAFHRLLLSSMRS